MLKKILTRKEHKVRLDHLPSLRMLWTVMFAFHSADVYLTIYLWKFFISLMK